MATSTIILLAACGIAAVVLIAILIWVLSLRRVVPTDEAHVVRQGSKTQEYGLSGSSAYYQWPTWVPVLGTSVTVLSLKNFVLEINHYEAYDKEKLPFVVYIKAFFQLVDWQVASTRATSLTDLKNQITDVVKGAARTILAQDDLETIMVERSKYGDAFTKEVETQLAAWGVKPIKTIELMDIQDASGEEVISNIMNKKKSAIEKDSRIVVAENKRAAQEAEIAAQQEVDLKQRSADEVVGLRDAEVKKNVGIATEESEQAVKEQEKITKDKEMQVKRVETIQQAEINRDRTLVDAEAKKREAEINKDRTIIDAEAEKKQVEINAEANLVKVTKNSEAELVRAAKDAEGKLITATKEAEGKLITATKNAEGIKLEGEAKAEAEEKMQLASVTAQTTLAAEIGSNEGYQSYLIEIRKVEASERVGLAQAENIGNADIKIIAGAGDVTGGISNAMGALSPKGGLALGGMLESLTSTEQGKALIEGLISKLGDNK